MFIETLFTIPKTCKQTQCPSTDEWIKMWCIYIYTRIHAMYVYHLLLFSRSVMSNSLWPYGLQYARPPCPSPSPKVCPSSSPLSRWCHLDISFSITPFSSRLQSFPASGSFPVSQFFTSGGQSTGVSVSTSVLPMSIQGWFPFGLTGLISLQSKGLSRVFFSTTFQRHQFFGTLPSLWSNSHICT